MKRIRKTREPRELLDWKKEAVPGLSQTYNELAGKPRTAVVKALLKGKAISVVIA